MIIGKWKGLGIGFADGPKGYSHLKWSYDVLLKHKNAKEPKRDQDGIHFTIEGRNILVKEKNYSSDNPKHQFFVVYGSEKDRDSKHAIVALFSFSSLLWDIEEAAPSDSFSVTSPVYKFDRPETAKWEKLAMSRLTSEVSEMARVPHETPKERAQELKEENKAAEMAVCSLCGKSRPIVELRKVNPNFLFCLDTCWNRRGKIVGSKHAGALSCPFYSEGMCTVDSGNTCSLSFGSYNTTCYVYRIGTTRRF